MRKNIRSLAALLAVTAAGVTTGFSFDGVRTAAACDDRCAGGPQGAQLTDQAVRDHVVAQGYKNPAKVKLDDGCFKIKTTDKDGNNVELLLHPVSGDVVKMERDS